MKKSNVLYNLLTADQEARVCKDIPDSACNDQPGNFSKHLTSLSLTKVADGLIDPKLILSWILVTLGSPAYFVGLLVPLREAGALLPQLFTAGYLRSQPMRKNIWALGSLVQGGCALLIGLSTLWLEGLALGVAVTLSLSVLALARSVCSVTYKDVLGKTVAKSSRGSVTGAASSVAAAFVIVFAILMASGLIEKLLLIQIGFFMAAAFWLLSALQFKALTEVPGATEDGGNALQVAAQHLRLLVDDRQLQFFILGRALLIATALAPPFMVALASSKMTTGYGELGFLLLASSIATLLSGYFWGRMADYSSRKVLLFSALAAGVTLVFTGLADYYGLLAQTWVLPTLIFGIMVAYQGVRLGRSTHLVDIAGADTRAAYTALSNTVIGLLLLLGGGFSILAQIVGERLVIFVLAGMSLVALLPLFKLNEVQSD